MYLLIIHFGICINTLLTEDRYRLYFILSSKTLSIRRHNDLQWFFGLIYSAIINNRIKRGGRYKLHVYNWSVCIWGSIQYEKLEMATHFVCADVGDTLWLVWRTLIGAHCELEYVCIRKHVNHNKCSRVACVHYYIMAAIVDWASAYCITTVL